MSGKLVVPQMVGEAYGIQLSHYGEDGAVIALGHHPARKMIAAIRRHSRVDLGLDDEDVFGYWPWDEETGKSNVIGMVRQSFATFTEDVDGCWYGRPGKTAQDAGALPVTVFEPW